MKSRWSTLVLLLVVSALILGGCKPQPPQPTGIPTATPREVAVQAPEGVLMARDAALAFVSERYPEQAAAPGLAWTERRMTPEGLVGAETFQYTAQDWAVTVSYPIVRPDLVVYQVVVSNETTGFQWEGRVDASGSVMEAPEGVLMARDAVLAFLAERYGEEAPAPGMAWTQKRVTPEGVVGTESYQLSAENWLIAISYPVVAPDMVVYQVVVSNPVTGFQWDGEVDAAGNVAELGAAAFDPILTARDAALAYLTEHYGGEVPAADMTWTRARITPQGLVGAETYEYRSGHWAVTISYPLVAPDAVVYRVVVSNQRTGFQWQGQVDAAGDVTETQAPTRGTPVVGWYGQVISLPGGPQFDDYLSLEPEGTGEVGLTGADPTLEGEIKNLRDSGIYAHFWGTLTSDVPDYNGQQLVVTRLRIEGPGPLFEPDPVEAWEGTLFSTPEMAQYDDYFVLAGDFAVRYGIDSSDPALAAQLTSLRDTQTTVRVWGRLTCGVMDVNGSRISVIAIAVIGEPPAPVPTSVSGWVGTIVPSAAGAQYDDYFEREDGQRFGIDSTDEEMQKRIQALRAVGSRVRIWGRLLLDVPDVEDRQIQLERYELASASEPVDGWVGIIVPLDPDAQYDDYFERDDGQRYGIETPDSKLAIRLETLRSAGSQVKVWGELFSDVPDVEGRQIQVMEIELVE